ncbi:MAG: diguanylate cyclase [Acidovorax sp.]
MTSLATLIMVCCIVLMNGLAFAGVVPDHRPVLWWTLFCAAGLVVFYVLIRSGWSRRLRDPSLTQAQMFYAIACNAVAYAIAGPARGITPPILAVTLMFGIFGLSTRQMLGVLFYGLAVFGIASVVSAWRGDPGYSPALAAAYLVMIAIVLLSGTFLTTRVQSTREHLRRQKHELAQALARISSIATRDELTGLLNRRAMLELMELEHRRSLRNGRPLVLAQLDIDHFKPINDTHGHATGDRALQAFADTVRANMRDTDVLARWGGEEFVLMLADTQPDDARALLDRIRLAVAALALPTTSGPLRMTVSAGLAQHLPGDAVEHTLERADQALYTAKALGRNRVAAAAPISALRSPAAR